MGTSALAPLQEAQQLGDILARNEEIHREILDETLASAEAGRLLESGRTVCGEPSDIRLPFERSARSVELSGCPTPNAGIWHTHVTHDQLRNPEHSLPDWANIVYDVVDASMVVGMETSEVTVQTADRDAVRREFHDVLGIRADSPAGVVRALANGDIENPPRARDRLRQRLSGTVRRIDTAYPEFEERLETAIPDEDPRDQLAPGTPERKEQFPTPPAGGRGPHSVPDIGNLRAQSRSIGEIAARINQMAPVDVKEQAFGTMIGTTIGFGVQHYFLDRWA